MSRIFTATSLVIIIIIIVVSIIICKIKIVPVLYKSARQTVRLEETWWAKQQGDVITDKNYDCSDTTINPFEIHVSDEIIHDLQERLDNALPFQPPLEGAKQHYGINTNLLEHIVDFWKYEYNWREREEFLNQFPQYMTRIQGLNIHYLHVKPKRVNGINVRPLIIFHGWPGSVREFYEIIPILTTPQKGRDFVFEVIAPSLPGYGFSDAATRPGMGATQMAVIFKNLMKRLGFKKYYVQGGDWGSVVAHQLAVFYPENLIGVHMNFCCVHSPLSYLKMMIASICPTLFVKEDWVDKLFPLWKVLTFNLQETGYMHMQATKPDTIGVALRDSPVGLAAYILEKFSTLTNPAFRDLDDAGLEKKFTYTSLLDNIMIFWITRTMTSAMRIYSEQFNMTGNTLELASLPITDVPTGCAQYRNDVVFNTEWSLRDKYKKLVYLSNYDDGHFAAFEAPETFAEDIYKFVDKVESILDKKSV